MDWYWILLIPIYILCYNVISYYRLKNIYNGYLVWLTNNNLNIFQKGEELKSLITCAGVSDVNFPVAKPLGYFQVATYNASVLDNFPSSDKELVNITVRLINRALGVYKNRIKNVFNPFWWANQIIFLPRSIFLYLGINIDKLIVKIVTLLWWLCGFIVMAMRFFYPDYLRSILDKVINILSV